MLVTSALIRLSLIVLSALLGALSRDSGGSLPSEYHQELPGVLDALSGAELAMSEALEETFAELGDRPMLDSGLVRAAQDLLALLESVPEDAEMPPVNEWAEFYLRRAGVSDALYFPVVLQPIPGETPYQTLGSLVEAELSALHLNRYGLALQEGENGLLVLLFSRRLADIAPFPIHVEPGSTQLLWGTLLQESTRPSLLLASPENGTIETVLRDQAGMFWTQVYFPEEPGEYMLEVLVHTDGPQVASLFPVYVGVPVPTRPVTRMLPGVDESAPTANLEAQAFQLLNAERVKRGLGRLVWSSSLADSARSHSRAMASQRRLTHELLSGEARPKGSYRENISLSTTLTSAHRNLVQSPSHRRTMLDSELRSVGVGIVEIRGAGDDRVLYMTQRFSSR